jgi:hypothetical protein
VYAGLDARTGAIRWRRSYTIEDGAAPADAEVERQTLELIRPRVCDARDGRLYVEVTRISRLTGVSRWIEACDMATGALLWKREIALQTQRALLSWGGALIVDVASTPGGVTTLTARGAADGELVGSLTCQGDLRAVSDDGVAYLLQDGDIAGRLRALRVSDGADAGATRAGEPDAIYASHSRFRDRDGRGVSVELRALDTTTGATRWVWRSPANLAALLRLWGPRAPGAFAASVIRQARKEGPALVRHARQELRVGQWRHPAALPFTRLDVAGDSVYLGGRLGIFALRASDGAPRWAGLPNSEVNTRLPLLVAPPGNATSRA